MSLGELYSREVVIVSRQGSMRDAVGLMHNHHFGDAMMVDEAVDVMSHMPVMESWIRLSCTTITIQ